MSGTVTAVDASGVTVSYTLSDGTPVQGTIAVAELLAPAYLVDGGDAEEEGEEYVEVEGIDPAQYYKVGVRVHDNAVQYSTVQYSTVQ